MKSIFLYLILVGVPVLAILGVLRAGQGLQSPIFVGGTWNIERSAMTDATSTCDGLQVLPNPSVLNITQSGSHLLLTLNDQKRTTLAGEIRNRTITGTTARLASNESLDGQGGGNASIQLRATVERDGGSDRLLGALTFHDCPTSTVISFSAQRQAAEISQAQ